MFRKIDGLTLLLVLVCAGWTGYARWKNLTYLEAGALRIDLIWKGEIHRLFTAAILHHLGNWLHLAFNAIGLFVLGPIVARECGRTLYLFCLFAAVFAGWAAGFAAYDPRAWHMGISGGLLGLIGLLVALEWAYQRSLRAFLRSRNTWVLTVTIVLGIVLTWWMNRASGPSFQASQAGHAGGLVAGLLVGFAWLGRARRRPVLGAVVALLVGIAPVAYYGHPARDPEYLRREAEAAIEAADWPRVIETVEALRERGPLLRTHGEGLHRAYLWRADQALDGGDPAEVDRWFAEAAALTHGTARAWRRFGQRAQEAGREDLALQAFDLAAARSALARRPSTSWESARHALPLHREAVAATGPHDPAAARICREALESALDAVDGLKEDQLPDTERDALEEDLAGTLQAVADVVEQLDGRSARGLPERLAHAFFRLGNVRESRQAAVYFLASAAWLWRTADGVATEDVARRYQGAYTAAKEFGNEPVAVLAARWFEERGLPLPPWPPSELAEPDGDG